MIRLSSFVLCFLILCTFSVFNYANTDDMVTIINSVDPDVLYEHVRMIQNYGPHPTGSEAIDEVAKYIYGQLEKYGLNVTYQYWSSHGLSGKNIVATKYGSSNFTLVISAHYDSVSVSPGANDDASGVASVLMAAEILSNYTFYHNLQFVLFSGEEDGLYGSSAFVKNAYLGDEHILADIQLDGIGYAQTTFGGNNIVISGNEVSGWIIDIVDTLATSYSEYVELVIDRRDYTRSDHQSFVNYGYEAVFFLEYEFSPYYHSPSDTIDHINKSYLTKTSKLAIGTLATIANKDIPFLIRFNRPERGKLYFNDRELSAIDSYHTVILGNVYASTEIIGYANVSAVDFYFNNKIKGIDEEYPFEHMYDSFSLFNNYIKATAYAPDFIDSNLLEIIVFNIAPN